MIIEIKDLMPSESYLVDLTNTETQLVKGGYAAFVLRQSNNPNLALDTAFAVTGQLARDERVQARQVNLGLSERTINAGIAFADSLGGGVFNAPATGAKLAG